MRTSSRVAQMTEVLDYGTYQINNWSKSMKMFIMVLIITTFL